MGRLFAISAWRANNLAFFSHQLSQLPTWTNLATFLPTNLATFFPSSSATFFFIINLSTFLRNYLAIFLPINLANCNIKPT